MRNKTSAKIMRNPKSRDGFLKDEISNDVSILTVFVVTNRAYNAGMINSLAHQRTQRPIGGGIELVNSDRRSSSPPMLPRMLARD